ncbi:MAG: sulfatase-like hydrolase/transferase, partial [Planctomycetota bacterium]
MICLTVVSAAPKLQAADKPNILFIFADDQSFETIRALGNREIQTPNLDQLVREGTTFTHAYNMGSWSGAVCVASRTMLNSGRFLWRANKIHSSSKKEQAEGRWWSEHMKQAGYRTYFTGKWHCKADAEASFDMARNIRGGMPKQTPEGYNRPLADGTDPWSPSDPKFGGYWKGGKHWSEVVADDTIDFINEAKNSDKPFFIYTAFNAPHDPRQSPAEYVDLYPLESIGMPKNFLPLYPHKDLIGLGTKQRDEKLGTFPRTEICVKTNRQEYYAIISHMDAQIGRILAALEESGLRENTWIFFTADHGLACGHHGLMGKQNMYDHSLRVPFIAIGPDVAKNQTSPEPIYLQDVMATTLELAGVER